jgi:hypothetical protein
MEKGERSRPFLSMPERDRIGDGGQDRDARESTGRIARSGSNQRIRVYRQVRAVLFRGADWQKEQPFAVV